MTPRQLLGQARVHTFEYVPYLASYIYSLREQETPGIGTAAVDEAGNLYWDPAFVTEVGRDQTAYLVAHEVLHLIFQHHSRSREIIGENPSDFERFVCNVAGDLVIEQTLHMMRHLRPDGCVHLGCEVPAWKMRLDFPENKSMQEYYRLIMEKLKERQRPQEAGDEDENDDEQGDSPQGDASAASDGAGDDQQQSHGAEDNSPQEGDSDGDTGQDGKSGGSAASGNDDSRQDSGASDGGGPAGSDGGGHPSDGEADASGGGAPPPAAGQGEAPPKPGAPGTGGSCADGQPRPYEVESDGAWETWGEDMAAAKAEEAIAQFEESHPGSVPGTIKQALQTKLRPQPDPFDQLRSAVCTSVASPVGGRDFSHRRRSRKQPPDDNVPLLHGRITVQPHAVVIVDTSGSMLNRDTMARALSVIGQGIRKLSRVKVFCADTHVRSHALVATTTTFEWDGGGGTNMARAIEEVDRRDKPDSIILVTDAETGWPTRKPHARVVVAYTGKAGSQWHQRIPHWCRTIALQGGANG